LLGAIACLRGDLGRVGAALAPHGVGLAQVGTDPLRPPRRTNPSTRYRAMEEHFTAVRTAACGVVTMNSTASIQVNLDAGPRRC
jgi:glutamate--cysteine ligase